MLTSIHQRESDLRVAFPQQIVDVALQPTADPALRAAAPAQAGEMWRNCGSTSPNGSF